MNAVQSRTITRYVITAVLLLAARAGAQPAVIERADWEARAPLPDISTYEAYGLAVPPYDTIVLHVTSMGYGAGAEEARRIQDFHMDSRGFSDIAYNYLVGAEGAVFEGRHLRYVPAHAGRSLEADARRDIRLDPDFGAIGIVFTVDADDPLSPAQVESAISLIKQLKQAHPITAIITHTEVGTRLKKLGLTPRTAFDPQACPGPGSIEQIVQIRLATDPDFDVASYRDIFD